MQYKHILRLACSVILSCYLTTNAYAFMNIEQERLRYKNSANFNVVTFNLNYLSGNTDKKSLELKDNLLFRNDENEYIALFSYKYAKNNGIKNEESGYIHLRHTILLNEDYAYEYFVQREQNKFKDDMRETLIGNGIRRNLSYKQNQNLYLGIGLFDFEEKFSNEQLDDIRANIYLSYAANITSSVIAASSAYLQPVIDDLSNMRYVFNASLSHNISKNISISFNYSMNYDSSLPDQVESRDASSTINLSYAIK